MMLNGQGIDIGRMAQQQAAQEAQMRAVLHKFILDTARDLYVRTVPGIDVYDAEDAVEKLAECAAFSETAAVMLAKKMFPFVKFEQSDGGASREE